MLIITAENEVQDTDHLNDHYNYGVLSFKDYKCPDFFFPRIEYLEEFNSASITLHIGKFEAVMPLHWSILCTDLENVQSIPLYEAAGRDFAVFCLNPIDGFMPEFHPLRTGTIFPSTTWMAPPMADKDMLVVPLGRTTKSSAAITAEARRMVNSTEVVTEAGPEVKAPEVEVQRGVKGPICAMFSPSKLEINKPISDIW